MFTLPFIVFAIEENTIDPVLLIVAVTCSVVGSSAKAAEVNASDPIRKSKLLSIYASGFVTTIFGYGVGYYYGNVVYTAATSALFSYMGTELLKALKNALIKFVSLLPDIAKKKIDKDE